MREGSILSNSVSLVFGRIFLSASRLLAVIIVTRVAGVEAFGIYALVLSFIALFDWLVDFGQTDIAVRDGIADGDRARWLAALARNKVLMSLVGAVLLPVTVMLIGYQSEVLHAALAGSLAVVAAGFTQIPKAVLKAAMRQDIDIAAEAVSVLLMLAGLFVAGILGAQVFVFVAILAAARLGHLGALLLLPIVRQQMGTINHIPWSESLVLGKEALPLGMAGLLAVVYESVAPILLSKLYGFEAVSIYAAATRFVMPVVIVMQALNAAFFPALAARFADAAHFQKTQQEALFLAATLSSLMFAGLFAGAPFLMALVDPELAEGALVLRLMAIVVLVRSITTVMTPMVIIARKQKIALILSSVSLTIQVLLQIILVPRFGATGAAISYLVTEPFLGAVAVSLLGQFLTHIRLDWWIVLKTYGTAAALVMPTVFLLPRELSVAAMLGLPFILVFILFLTGVLTLTRLGELRSVLRVRPTGGGS